MLIDFGSGTLELKIKLNKTTHRLDDGDWHRLDIFWDTENVRMVLDLCRYATIYEPEDGTASIFNTSACEVKGVIPPFNEYLDVSSPLQIGGVSHASLDPSQFRWDHLPHGKGFSGCIRNFIHNSKVLFFPFFNSLLNHLTFVSFYEKDLRPGRTRNVAGKSAWMRSAG